MSRLIDTLAADAPRALRDQRGTGRRPGQGLELAGSDAPDHNITSDRPLAVDLDASLLTAHSEKELATPTYKRGFGFHPIGAWIDHGEGGTGEPAAILLRTGSAGSNTAADHIEITQQALRQLPSTTPGRRPGRKILIRTDGASGTHDFVKWLAGQRLQYSVGFTLSWDAARETGNHPAVGVDPGV